MIIIGFMGAGKTTLAKIIAEKTGLSFNDTDFEVVDMTGISIPQIFAYEGESGFREYEYLALKSSIENFDIISAGGGIVTYNKSFKLLEARQDVVFLKTDFDTMYNRIKNDQSRPNALRSYDELYQLYKSRLPLYEEVADKIITNPSEIIDTF